MSALTALELKAQPQIPSIGEALFSLYKCKIKTAMLYHRSRHIVLLHLCHDFFFVLMHIKFWPIDLETDVSSYT